MWTTRKEKAKKINTDLLDMLLLEISSENTLQGIGRGEKEQGKKKKVEKNSLQRNHHTSFIMNETMKVFPYLYQCVKCIKMYSVGNVQCDKCRYIILNWLF